MKYGATGAARGMSGAASSLTLATMAGTSREYQRPATTSLRCSVLPPGSLMRSKPVIVTTPRPSPPTADETGTLSAEGTKPRFTKIQKPAVVCSGVITQKPRPSSVLARTKVCLL